MMLDVDLGTLTPDEAHVADATTYCSAQWVKGFLFQRQEFHIIDCHGGE